MIKTIQANKNKTILEDQPKPWKVWSVESMDIETKDEIANVSLPKIY